MTEYVIDADDPAAADVHALLLRHLDFAHQHSPPEDVHALDGAGLAADDVTFFSVRENGVLLGVGALRRLDDGHVELKSMHTAIEARGRGVGQTMLDHLVDVARTRGYQRISLETGSMAAFEPARRLYARNGFEVCEPFGDYVPSSYSTFLTREL
jgi:putative acetyltransferase